jgi:hypothetical protein
MVEFGWDVDTSEMSDQAGSSGRLQELVASIGSPDEVAPVDQASFARKAGEIIANAVAKARNRYMARRSKIKAQQHRRG